MSTNPQNICLFCIRSNSFDNTITNVSGPIRQFFKLLRRFIESEDNGITIHVAQLLENEFSKVLNFCKECTSVVDQFCDLYHKLKCLEMQLEWKLDGLVQVIKLGGKVPSRALHLDKVLEDKFKNDKSKISKTRNLLKTLRQSIIQNGQRRLKLSTPRVMLKRKPCSNTSQIIEPANLLNDDVRSIYGNPDKECQESLINDGNNSNSFASDHIVSFEISEKDNVVQDKYNQSEDGSESVQDTTNKTRNDDVVQSDTSFLEPDDSLPEINDEDESLNGDFEIANVEQESFTSEILGESGTLKIEQAVLLQEISKTPSQLQLISPVPSSLIIENVGLNNVSNATTSSTRISKVPNNSEIDPVEISVSNSVIPEVSSPIQPSKQISSKIIEHLDQKETDTIVTSSSSNQRYNLRKKPKIKFAEETSSDDDVLDDNCRMKYTSKRYTSSETSSDSEDLDGRDRSKNRSRHSCSSETTSESEDTDNDIKPLKRKRAAQRDNPSLAIAKSCKIKRKRKKPVISKEPLTFSIFSNEKETKPENDNEHLDTSPTDLSGQTKEKGVLNCAIGGCSWRFFRNEEMYHEHITLHITGQFNCAFCETVANSLINLSFHEYNKHSKIKTKTDLKGKPNWVCPRCTHESSCYSDYETHFANTHFKEFVDQYKDIPTTDVVTKIDSERHAKLDTPIRSESEKEKGKNFKCYSDGCNKLFHNEKVYQNHKKLHENGEFQRSLDDSNDDNECCDESSSCSSSATSDSSSNEDTAVKSAPSFVPCTKMSEIIDTVTKPLKRKPTKTAKVKQKPRKLIRLKDTPTNDVVTKKDSERPEKLQTPIKSESEKDKGTFFKCFSDGCNKLFDNEKVYQNHRKLHESGEFQCSFCDIKETNLIRLSTHEYKSHTPDERQKQDSREQQNVAHAWTCPRCLQKCYSLKEYHAHFSYTHFGVGDVPNTLDVKTSIKRKPLRRGRRRGRGKDATAKFCEKLNDLKGFRCNLCKTRFPDKAQIKQHIRLKHRLNIVQQTAIRENDKMDSKTDPSKSDKIYSCNFCEMTFEHAPDLAIHERQHATVVFAQPRGKKQQLAEGKKFQCPRCPYKFNLQTIYIRHHLTNHLNILANTLPGACTMCSGGTIYFPNSEDHFDRFHNKNLLDDPSLISECDECSAYFLKPFQLFLHKKKIHQGNVHKCQFCDKICPQKSGLKTHLYNVHKYSDEDPKLPFGCDSKGCKKRCSSLGELDLHKIFHRSTTACMQRKECESTTCEECGKVYKSKGALSMHKFNVHSKKKFVCQECGKPFKSRVILNTHMLYHQSPDDWEFECTECGKKCTTKGKLDEHMRTHTKEKPFVCQFCGEPYAHRHNWRNHLKTKHGDEEGAQEDINGILNKAQGASFMSRKGSKKGDCIIAGKSVKL